VTLRRCYAISGFWLAAAIILGSCVDGDRQAGTFIADPCDTSICDDTTAPGSWNTDYIRDYNYAEGRIFDLFYPEDNIGPYDEVNIVICEEETRSDNPDAKEVYLKTKMDSPRGPYDNADVRMRNITGDSAWEVFHTNDPLRSPWAIVFYASKRRAVGVRMTVVRNGDTILSIGYSGTDPDTDPDTVRVLHPLNKDMLPSNPAWNLMWRNCYRMPRGVLIPELEVKVFKGLMGTEGSDSCLDYQSIGGMAGDPYIRILGLDQVNNSNPYAIRNPDGMIDPFVETHNPDWGLLLFPHREPFCTDTTFESFRGEVSDQLADTILSLYHYESRSEKLFSSKYYLQVRSWRPDYIR
jgi:hypothetical protein